MRVVDGGAHCPAPDIDERRTLGAIAAPGTVRLACQVRPTGDISVEIVLRIERSSWVASPPLPPSIEREAAVLFFDLALKAIAAQGNALAHDTMYALGRFQTTVADVLETASCVILPRAGNHWMALFGRHNDVREGSRQAAGAAGINDPALDWQALGIDAGGASLLCADASDTVFTVAPSLRS